MFRRVTFRKAAKPADDEDTDPDLLKKHVVLRENQPLSQDYNIEEYLGSGKFGEVKRCVEKRSGGVFAGKFVPIACKEDRQSVLNEIAIMNILRHPRLIQLYDAYAYRDEMVLVIELITGGELFERIIDESFDLNESRCIRFMKEILQGVEYIHAQHVLHLDLKPENVLCLSSTSFKIKIIDFGLARFHDGKELCVLFGTPEFVSPEVISYEPVTWAADMWSVGVVCYVMLSGLSPFMGDNSGETLANIMRVKYDFNYPEFEEISEEARKFIRKLLMKDPKKRMSATECLEHTWIKGKRQLKRKGTVSKKRLKHFVYRRKWQKAINAIIALQRMGVVLIHSNYTTDGEVSIPTGISATPCNSKTSKSLNQCPSSSGATSPNRTSLSKNKTTKDRTQKKERKLGFSFKKLSGKRSSDKEILNPSPKATSSQQPKLMSVTNDSRNSAGSIKQEKQSDSEKQVLSNPRSNESEYPISTSEAPDQKTYKGIIHRLKGDDKSKSQSPTTNFKMQGKHPIVNNSPARSNSPESQLLSPPSVPEKRIDSETNRKEKLVRKEITISVKTGTTTFVNQLKPISTQRPRKVAPAIGGISAKIGFFSNLSDESPQVKPPGKKKS